MSDFEISREFAPIRKLIEQGEVSEASTQLRKHLESAPQNPEVHFLFSEIAKAIGNFEMARGFLDKALQLAPDSTAFLLAQGDVLIKLGKPDEAVQRFQRILISNPRSYEAHLALGKFSASQFRFEEARRHLEFAVDARSTPEANNLLGHVLVELGVHDEAERVFESCLKLDANNADALVQMGSLALRRSDFLQALSFYRRAYAVAPDHPELLWNVAFICLNRGEPISSCRDWLPLNARILSQMIFALNYQSDLSRELIAAAHREWGEQQTRDIPRVERPVQRRRRSEAKTRLGFVSGDFFQHPVGRLAAAIFSNLDRAQFDCFVYDNGSPRDQLTQRIQSFASEWRSINACDDDETARLISSDDVDVLIDLSGHTMRNRLLVFARRPAPVQVTLFAYPNTTGLEAMDYRITDVFADPPGMTEPLYTERLIRLSQTAWVYLPPESEVFSARKQSADDGAFIFGCLNNPQKVSEAAIELWSQLLERLPRARLALLTLNENHARSVARKFVDRGVPAERLRLLPRAGQAAYLEYHRDIDVMLDPLPYNGGVTSCDSLWMGVPVLTLAGDTYLSRQGVSILSNVALHDFVANSHEDFLERACALASSRQLLAKLRSELRLRLRQSPMMNFSAYAKELGAVLQKL